MTSFDDSLAPMGVCGAGLLWLFQGRFYGGQQVFVQNVVEIFNGEQRGSPSRGQMIVQAGDLLILVGQDAHSPVPADQGYLLPVKADMGTDIGFGTAEQGGPPNDICQNQKELFTPNS